MKSQVAIEFLPYGGMIRNIEYPTQNNLTLPYDENNPDECILKHPNLGARGKTGKIFDKERRIYLDGTPCLYKSGEPLTYKLCGTAPYNGYNSASISESESDDDETGYFFPAGKEPTLTLKGKNINSVVVWFDDIYQEYAPLFEINGDTVVNHRLFYVYNLTGPQSEVVIKINSWNCPGRCAKIKRVLTTHQRVFEADRITGLELSNEDRPDPAKVEYGLSSQFGSVELLDIDNEFAILNEFELLQDDQPITINTVEGDKFLAYNQMLGYTGDDGKINEADRFDAAIITKEPYKITPIGVFRSQNWEIKPNDTTIKVNLTDRLSRLRDKQFSEVTIKELSASPLSARNIIERLLSLGGLPEDGQSLRFDSAQTEETLSDILGEDIYFEKGSVYEQLKKVLEYCKCRLYFAGEEILIKSI